MSYQSAIEHERAEFRRAKFQAAEILDRSEDRKQPLSKEDEARFDRLLKDAEASQGRIEKLEAADRAARAADSMVRGMIGSAGDRADGGTYRGGYFNFAGSSPRSDEIRDMLESRERQHDFAFPTSDEIRASVTDFAQGSSLYPSDFSSRVAVYARTESPWIGAATVVNADNGRPLIVPTLTGDPTVYSPGEGTAITDSPATLGTVTVTPTGYKALISISAEAFEDTEVNLTDLLARVQARAISLAFGSAATTTVLAGIGNLGTATGLSAAGTATFVGYEDLVDASLAIAGPYRANASWVMANSMIKKARKYRGTTGQYVWEPDAQAGSPAPLLGAPVLEDPYLAAVASATKSTVFGDLGAALVIKASPMRVALSTDYGFNTDTIWIKTVHRLAIAVQDPAAAGYIVSAAS